MMTYINNETEIYYDFNMITDILPIHSSLLKREMREYGFSNDQYIKYKNRHLYTLNSVADFIVYLLEKQATRKNKTS